ncbi:MAG TPA: lysylphosphatidylglycerol synthase transmembrane domain-containing protein, partial [Kofleriaceae bacterium]|nr:lysylphosphatidylglycerol synthase transmembrane domain-containing protein [Kofleriaceae bacterium]
THISEPREFAQLVERAAPGWVAVALGLQALTYLALAQVWRAVVRAAQGFLPLRLAVHLALAKLFVDQALPTGGISGGLLVVSALERRGLVRPLIVATVVVEIISYYLAYAGALAVAVAIAVAQGHARAIVLWSALAFVGFALVVAIGALALTQSTRPAPDLPGLRRAQRWLAGADRHLVRDARLLARATGWQLAIVALDGLTLWTLLRAAGTDAPLAGTFASFMIASLARTVSIVPGGLGVFEGVAVVTLHQIGAPLAAALSATLLFRGVSYWLPMIPGFLASRRLR